MGRSSTGQTGNARQSRTALSSQGAFLRTLLIVLCLILCGCGLLADSKHKDAKDETGMEEAAMPQNPQPYAATFVVETDDGSKASSSAASISKEKAQQRKKTKQGASDGSSGSGADDKADDAAHDASSQEKAEDPGSREPDAKTGETGQKAAAKDKDKGQAAFFAKKMQELSQLARLKDKLPDGGLGLELRARKDVETAKNLMASEGYYDGTAELSIEEGENGKAKVTISMKPGIRYCVGDISVNYLPDLQIPSQLADHSEAVFPRTTLPGVTQGKPISAEAMLKSVDSIPEKMHRNAFPDAKIKEAYFYLDREKHTLNAIIDVEPGSPALIGRPIFTGNATVKTEYLNKLVTWEPGAALWNQEEVDDYVSRLRTTGLFKKVAVSKKEGRDGATNPSSQDLEVQLEEAPHRSISLAAEYATDTGFGVNAAWEHRNLFGQAEKLTVKVPYTATERGVKADFTKPFFYSDKNTLHMWGETLYETTDAYERQGVKLNASLKRRWSKYLTTETGPFADAGWLKNNKNSNQDYRVYGLSLKGTLDTRDSDMNPTRGTVAQVSLQPLSGCYGNDFTALGTEVLVSGYWAPFTRKDGTKDDKLVLAGRVGLGSITGASLNNLPSTYRYYLGGVNTVRGYGYQQIGPMDASGDPTGGRSYQRVNLESRFKVSDSLGFVAFLDGGKLYTEEYPQFETDMDWGAGAGVRYYTPIGPIRVDVGVPLSDAEPPLQIYISIGQAF